YDDNDISSTSSKQSSSTSSKQSSSTSNKRSSRNEPSEVWGYFKKVIWTKEQKTAKCSVQNCIHKEYSCGSDGTTRPLWRHLESAHWTQYVLTEEYRKKKKKVQEKCGSIEESTTETSTIVSTEVDNMKLRKMVATWIINRQRPLSIVEDPELIEILQYLNPTVQLVKADTIKKTVMTFYSLGKKELKTYLPNIGSKLSFTSDLWTSPNNKSFISVTGHYIDENWALKEIIIDFGLLSGKHDGVNIANGFYHVLKDYNIASKFLAITLDNASNNNVFVRELAMKLKEETNISWEPERLRFRCFNHILNLAAQAALDHIKEDVSKIRELNSAIRATPQRTELFENTCNACRIKFIKPILDCPTRWNSTFDMVKNGLLLKSALNTLTSSHDDFYPYSISHSQWTTLEKIVEFLEPFKDLTVKMSSGSDSTAFWIIPLFNIVFNHVEDVASNVKTKNRSVSPIFLAAVAAREKLVQYYSRTNTTIMLCTVLDPRRKFHYFVRKEFPSDEIDGTKAFLFETEYAASFNDNILSSTSGNIVKSYTRSILDADFEEEEVDTNEFDRYISEKPANKEIDVLAWWKVSVVNTLLAIPASSVASERAFSSGENMITNKRSNLAPKTVRASQCLRSWIQ
ncbi:1455_t:CDS:2, partial [Gigaspora margarita]